MKKEYRIPALEVTVTEAPSFCALSGNDINDKGKGTTEKDPLGGGKVDDDDDAASRKYIPGGDSFFDD